jgi:D-3-phosphoglycerate dehydrogenase
MQNRYRILLSAPYMLPVYDRFQPLFSELNIEVVRAPVAERLSESELLAYAGEVDGVICGDDKFTARALKAFAPRLKVISKWGTGIDSIDRKVAAALGIQVCNTPGAFTEAVADTVIGYVLAFARRLPDMSRDMKKGMWRKYRNHALHECILGVVGVGNIGGAVLRRAAAFGMQLFGNDIVEVDPEILERTRASMVPLTRLLSESDYVSLNPDLNPTSYHLINHETLGVMKEGAVLINTSRGPVVDEWALIEALQHQRIRGAALDVFEQEPLPADSPLRSMDNVMLSPHNANSSPAAWERVHWNTMKNLFAGLGVELPGPLRTRVEEMASSIGEGALK